MAKNIMRAFKMHEISAVTSPAQKGARAAIMKLDDAGDFAKAIAELAMARKDDEGAKSFSETLADADERKAQSEANEELWPLFCALEDSLRSIAGDNSLAMDAKLSGIKASIDQFAATVAERMPDVEAEVQEDAVSKMFTDPVMNRIYKAVRKVGDHVGTKETSMSDAVKKVADLEAQVADLQKKHTEDAAALVKANDEITALKKTAEIAKSDETFEAEGTTIRKSEVGEGTFKVLKAQQERIEIGTFEKAAEKEYGNLPGEPVAKAKVLRAVSKLAEAEKTELEKMLKAGNAAMAKAFKTVGKDDAGNFEKAGDELEAKAAEYHKANPKLSKAAAYDEFLTTEEGRSLYAKSQGERFKRVA